MIFSASRISAFLQCKRAWAWHYLAGYSRPEDKWHDIGKATHKVLESFVSDGTLPNTTTHEGLLASRLTPYVQRFVGVAVAEGRFEIQGRHALWQGYKDLEVPGEVIDYKTTSDLKWAATEDSLRYDPQALVYAHDNMTKFDLPTVKLTWLYVQKKKPIRHLPVSVEMTREHAAAGFEALDSFAAEAMTLTAKTDEDILALPGTYTSCGNFGGCPHRLKCNRMFI